MASSATPLVSPTQGVTPLFVKASTLAPLKGTYLNGLDICYALENVSGKGTVDCVQRMGDLFRVYAKTEMAKEDLLIKGFSFNNISVSLLARNPFQVKDQKVRSTKLFIGGVPMSVADSEVERALLDENLKLLSDLKYETYRDSDGKWTHFKTGRRFVFIEIPELNLKPFLQIGLWRANLFYKEQIRPKKTDTTAETPVVPTPTTTASTGETTSSVLSNIATSAVITSTAHVVTGEATHVVTASTTHSDSTQNNKSNTGKSTNSLSVSDSQLLRAARGGGVTNAVVKTSNGSANEKRGRSPTRHRSRRGSLKDHWSPAARSLSTKRKVGDLDLSVSDEAKDKQRKTADCVGSLGSSFQSTEHPDD